MGDKVESETFTWVIKDVDSLESEEIFSDPFVIAGCSWCVVASANGNKYNHWLSLSLSVADAEYLPHWWSIHAEFSFTIVNQSSKKLSNVEGLIRDFTETIGGFDHKTPACDCASTIPIGKLDAKYGGFILNGQVKIVAEVRVVKANARYVIVHGFPVVDSEVEMVRGIFEKHPDIGLDFTVKNSSSRRDNAFIVGILTNLVRNMRKPVQEIPRRYLVSARHSLEYMIECGYKVGWLEKELNEVTKTKEEEEEEEGEGEGEN